MIRQVRRGRTTKGQGGMLSAYVLIESEVGKVAHVAQALTKLDGVQLAEDLAGPTTSSRGWRRAVSMSSAG